jgi:hypothetical protein
METVSYSETMVLTFKSTLHFNPETDMNIFTTGRTSNQIWMMTADLLLAVIHFHIFYVSLSVVPPVVFNDCETDLCDRGENTRCTHCFKSKCHLKISGPNSSGLSLKLRKSHNEHRLDSLTLLPTYCAAQSPP